MDERGWPRDVKSLVKRAEDLILKGSSIDFIYACDALDEALYLLPNDPVLLVIRGRVLRQIGDLDNAREDFKKAINLAPDFVPLLLKTLNLDTIL
jgi:Flp pilus assembly protein TadD